MKVRTLITSASVTLALVVPVAANAQSFEAYTYAAQQRTLPAKPATTIHQYDRDRVSVVTLVKQIKTLAKQNQILRAKLQNLWIRLVQDQDRWIVEHPITKPPGPSTVDPSVNCSDETDSCTVEVPAQVTTPAEQSPAVNPVEEVSVTASSQDTGALSEPSPVELALGSGEESC